MVCTWFSRIVASEASSSVGMGMLRQKSQPVPLGTNPRTASSRNGPVGIDEAVDHLVEGTVAADADDPLGPGQQMFPRHPGGFSRSGRQAGLEGSQSLGGQGADAGPFFARRSVSRMRIYDKDRFSGIHADLPHPQNGCMKEKEPCGRSGGTITQNFPFR